MRREILQRPRVVRQREERGICVAEGEVEGEKITRLRMVSFGKSNPHVNDRITLSCLNGQKDSPETSRRSPVLCNALGCYKDTSIAYR